MSKDFNFRVRAATTDDLLGIADAHQASILEIGAAFYYADDIQLWGRKWNPAEYPEAMDNHGEVFFIADTAAQPGHGLGFSSYRHEDGLHRLQALYVRGSAKNLLKSVERHAKAAGARELHVEASLSGEAFYRANGFTELNRHNKPIGGTESVMMAAIMMVKPLIHHG